MVPAPVTVLPVVSRSIACCRRRRSCPRHLREGHAGVAPEQPAEGAFAGSDRSLELGQAGGDVAQPRISRRRLTCFLTGGIAGTLLGGRIADRFGLTRTVLVGNAAAIPALMALRACPGAGLALVAALAAGVTVRIPFSVLVKLGQDYLPSRPARPQASRSASRSAQESWLPPYSAPSPRPMAFKRCSRSFACCRYPPWRCPCYCPNRSIPAECARRQGNRYCGPDR